MDSSEKDLTLRLVAQKTSSVIEEKTGRLPIIPNLQEGENKDPSDYLEQILYDAKALLPQETNSSTEKAVLPYTPYKKEILFPMLDTIYNWSLEEDGGRAGILRGFGITPEVIGQVKRELFNKENPFREFPPLDFLTTRFTVKKEEQENLRDIVSKAGQTIKEKFGFDFRYSGFWSSSSTKVDEIHYNFTHYPRTRLPEITREQYELSIVHLSTTMREEGLTPRRSTIEGPWDNIGSKHGDKDCRILFGRREGYDEDAKVYTLEYIKSLLPENIGMDSADIFSVSKTGKYEEPAVLLYVNAEDIPLIYQIAHYLRQERFTVEYFKIGKSYTVEIDTYCKQPDPRPSVDATI